VAEAARSADNTNPKSFDNTWMEPGSDVLFEVETPLGFSVARHGRALAADFDS
jgi:hypothetical protein